jgi:hypothetical protein
MLTHTSDVNDLLTQWLAMATQDGLTEWADKLRQGLQLLPQASSPTDFVALLGKAGL